MEHVRRTNRIFHPNEFGMRPVKRLGELLWTKKAKRPAHSRSMSTTWAEFHDTENAAATWAMPQKRRSQLHPGWPKRMDPWVWRIGVSNGVVRGPGRALPSTYLSQIALLPDLTSVLGQLRSINWRRAHRAGRWCVSLEHRRTAAHRHMT